MERIITISMQRIISVNNNNNNNNDDNFNNNNFKSPNETRQLVMQSGITQMKSIFQLYTPTYDSLFTLLRHVYHHSHSLFSSTPPSSISSFFLLLLSIYHLLIYQFSILSFSPHHLRSLRIFLHSSFPSPPSSSSPPSISSPPSKRRLVVCDDNNIHSGYLHSDRDYDRGGRCFDSFEGMVEQLTYNHQYESRYFGHLDCLDDVEYEVMHLFSLLISSFDLPSSNSHRITSVYTYSQSENPSNIVISNGNGSFKNGIQFN